MFPELKKERVMKVKLRVKLTDIFNPALVVFGNVVEMTADQELVVLTDKGGRYIVNPNSDYNFRFIPNEEADNKFQEALNAHADAMEALEKKSKRFC